MPDAGPVRRSRSVASRTLAVAFGLAASVGLSGCLYATGGVSTFEIRSVAVASPAYPVEELQPSPTEITYARDTARVLFRRKAAERTRDFVASDPASGYALCIRSGPSYALLVFQRRIFEPGISQVADDVAILRAEADTAVCRRRNDWTPA